MSAMKVDWRKHFESLSEGASFGGEIDFGVDGGTIEAVQTKLNALGFANPPLTIDGASGPMTETAVKAFQQSLGLTADGIIGAQTLGALGIPVPASSAPAASGNQTELPNKATPMTADDVAKAISAGYKKVTGQNPTPPVLALMLAQSSFETGGWGKGIHNYNFGNAKATSRDPYYQVFTATEGQGSNVTSSAMKFAAYKNPEDAGAAYVQLLKGRPNWWNGLQTGTAEGFINGLTTAPAYFTGNAASYLSAVKAGATKYAGLASQYATVGTAIAVGLASTWLVAGGVIVGGLAIVELVKGLRS
jgi:peptidoglycan hydrolase-like protein with peptidoglycan-binding domain